MLVLVWSITQQYSIPLKSNTVFLVHAPNTRMSVSHDFTYAGGKTHLYKARQLMCEVMSCLSVCVCVCGERLG